MLAAVLWNWSYIFGLPSIGVRVQAINSVTSLWESWKAQAIIQARLSCNESYNFNISVKFNNDCMSAKFSVSLLFLIHISIMWISVMSHFLLAGWSSIHTEWQKLHHWTLCRNIFIPAKLRGTIGFYHIRPLSLTLTLAGGHKVSTKQNLLALFSHALFNWFGWNLIWCWSNFKLNTLILLLSEIK